MADVAKSNCYLNTTVCSSYFTRVSFWFVREICVRLSLEVSPRYRTRKLPYSWQCYHCCYHKYTCQKSKSKTGVNSEHKNKTIFMCLLFLCSTQEYGFDYVEHEGFHFYILHKQKCTNTCNTGGVNACRQ